MKLESIFSEVSALSCLDRQTFYERTVVYRIYYPHCVIIFICHQQRKIIIMSIGRRLEDRHDR